MRLLRRVSKLAIPAAIVLGFLTVSPGTALASCTATDAGGSTNLPNCSCDDLSGSVGAGVTVEVVDQSFFVDGLCFIFGTVNLIDTVDPIDTKVEVRASGSLVLGGLGFDATGTIDGGNIEASGGGIVFLGDGAIIYGDVIQNGPVPAGFDFNVNFVGNGIGATVFGNVKMNDGLLTAIEFSGLGTTEMNVVTGNIECAGGDIFPGVVPGDAMNWDGDEFFTADGTLGGSYLCGETVYFATFVIDKAEIETEEGEFEVKGSFRLGSGTNGIDPVAEQVTLEVGTFSVTIEAGSFEFTDSGPLGEFEFEGVIDGVELEIKIRPLEDGTFEFEAEVEGAALDGADTVVLTIGDDTGPAEVVVDDDDDE